jgi:uncharacterized protein
VKIVIVGATGFIGSKILAEAVSRGHIVTALCRHPDNVAKYVNVRAVQVEVIDTAQLAGEFAGHAAIIHAYSPPRDAKLQAIIDAQTAALRAGTPIVETVADMDVVRASTQARIDGQMAGTRSIIAAAKSAGVKRVLAVGGAGTLLIDGVRSMDRPDFPKLYLGGARSTAVVKELLGKEHDLEWTVLCPSTLVAPGERTGKFRLGSNELLIGSDGSSRVSLQDFAMAMIDELETPRHVRKAFTVGY